MTEPLHSTADYLSAEQQLMPTGPIWPSDSDSIQTATLRGFAPTGARLEVDANALLTDAFPSTAVFLLPEWEATLGLPDPCAGATPTLQQRQAQVVARLANAGGQSAAFFIEYAGALGYTITIKRFAPFQVGQSRTGDPICGAAWAYAWAVQAPETTYTSFRTGLSAVGEPLRAWGNDVLECELRAVAPAYGPVLFEYS